MMNIVPKGIVRHITDGGHIKSSKSNDEQSSLYFEVQNLMDALENPLDYISKRINVEYPIGSSTVGDFIVAGKEGSVLNIGKHSIIGDGVIFRLDEITSEAGFHIGERTSIGQGTVFHSSGNIIGNNVSIFPYAVIHGCNVGDNSIIGMGSVIDKGAEIKPGTIMGPFCYIDKPQERKIIPAGTISMGDLELRIPEDAMKKMADRMEKTFLKGKSASIKEHTYNGLGFGFFDPLAYVESPNIENNVKNLYFGPKSITIHSTLLGPNVNFQDYSNSVATTHHGHNNKAHWANTVQVNMDKGATVFISSIVEYFRLGEHSFVGPVTYLERNPIQKETLEPGMAVAGYVPKGQYETLKRDGSLFRDGQKIAALLPRDSIKGLEHRIEHISELNNGHSLRDSDYLEASKNLLFNPRDQRNYR